MQSPLITDWISAISAAVTAVAAIVYTCITIGILKYGYEQVKSLNTWNCLNASFKYFEDDILYKLTDDLYKEFDKIPIDAFSPNEPLSEEQLKKINDLTLPDYYHRLKAINRVLGYLEAYATAYYAGVFDKNVSRELYEQTIQSWVSFFKPYIDEHSTDYKNLIKLNSEWNSSTGDALTCKLP